MPASVLLPANGDYAELRRIVRREGLLEPRDAYYATKLVVALAVILAGVAVLLFTKHPVLVIADAVFLAFGSTQMALLSHDIIHRQAFRGKRTNEVLRLLVGNLMLGISPSWWDAKHSQHHANPNHIDKDPDIQLPFLAFSQEQLANRPTWLRPIIRRQVLALFMVFPLQAVAMYWTSLLHMASGAAPRRTLQWALVLAHFAVFGWLLSLLEGWLFVTAFTAVYLGAFGLYNSSVFASNHKGMPLTADGRRLDFLREQVLTSRDLSGHRITDFLYGGLNYQIEHHLFPTMPRCNLARARAIVEPFCAARGIAYHSTSVARAYRETVSHLNRESASLRQA